MSVVSVLRTTLADPSKPNKGTLYQDTGRVEEQMLVSILPTGEKREHRMAEIDLNDIKIFADELDIALKLENPIIQSLFEKNAVALVNLVRVVNTETLSGFKGMSGAGRQLDAVMFRAEQFQNPASVPVAARTTWARAYAAAGTFQFVCAADVSAGAVPDAHGDLTMIQFEGLAILGFVNIAAAPGISAFQPTYLTIAKNIQTVDFELFQPFSGDAIVEMKQPLILYPNESGRIDVRAFRATLDEMRPIGIWVKLAQNMRALATS